MYPNKFWKIEFTELINNKKNFITKLALPLILMSPLVIPEIPFNIKASIFTLIIIFISTFSSAVSLTQLKESKIIERIAMLPISDHKFIFEYIIASSFIDFIKFVIPFTLLLVFNLKNFQLLTFFWVLITFIISIIFANCLGIIVALLANTAAEVHLYSIIMVLGISFISGIFFNSFPFFLSFLPFLTPFHYLLKSILFYENGILIASIYPLVIITITFLVVTLISSRLFRFD